MELRRITRALSKTLAWALHMSAFRGKADISWKRENVR
jgi:hypothetical protein